MFANNINNKMPSKFLAETLNGVPGYVKVENA